MGSSSFDMFSDGLSGVTDVFGGGDDAAKAARRGAGVTAQYQRDALDYLKETEALPQELREASLMSLAGLYGLEGYESPDMIAQAQANPLYQAMIQQIDQSIPMAEDAILRNASATGMLRSGDSISNLAQQAQNAQLAKSQALADVYGQQVSGLQGLAKLPTQAHNIANMTAGIGQTLGQGIVGAAQSQQAGDQAGFNNLMGMAKLGLTAASFSDKRLKDKIVHLGKIGEYNWYQWLWNDDAKKLGLSGVGEGVMAHEVFDQNPEAIGESEGYLTVNYDMLEA